MFGLKITGLVVADYFRSLFQVVYMPTSIWLVAQEAAKPVAMAPAVAFSMAGLFAVLGGMGSLWASPNQPLTSRLIVSHALNMGTCGISLAMILSSTLEPSGTRDYFIIGVIGVASLSGMKLIKLAQDIGSGLISKLTQPVEGNK